MRAPRGRLLILVGLVAAGWFTWLRPATLGGKVSYVIVDGSSMEPTYEDGDLVLVRERGRYRRGEVIAFRAGGQFDDPTRIIHRIVGGDARNGFVTQGDNRDETDPWSPTGNDIIGAAGIHIPMAGDIAALAALPQTMAALGGVAAVLGSRRRRRRRPIEALEAHADGGVPVTIDEVSSPTTPPQPRPRSGTRLLDREPRWAFVGLLATILLAVPTLAMAWSALRAPDSIDRVEQFGAVDYGIDLDYTLVGQPSPVYPTGQIRAGTSQGGTLEAPGPLYRRLLDRIEIAIGFRVLDDGADRVDSSYSVAVEVATPDGWSAELDGLERSAFRSSATETVTLDLTSIGSRVQQIAQLTGVGGTAYTVTVTPRLELGAEADEVRVAKDVAAPLVFAVAGEVITAEASGASGSEPLTRTISERASYTIGWFDLGTQTARAVLSGLTLVLVAGIAWFASVLFGGLGLHEPARIAARYRSQIVDVSTASAPPGPTIMVGSIEELARIAKVDQNVILHEDPGDGAHRYRVFLGTVTYVYETAPEHPGAASAPATVGEDDRH